MSQGLPSTIIIIIIFTLKKESFFFRIVWEYVVAIPLDIHKCDSHVNYKLYNTNYSLEAVDAFYSAYLLFFRPFSEYQWDYVLENDTKIQTWLAFSLYFYRTLIFSVFFFSLVIHTWTLRMGLKYSIFYLHHQKK